MAKKTHLTVAEISNAVRNEYDGASFTLGGREFPIHDLDYDSFLEFIHYSKPIVEAMVSAFDADIDAQGEVQASLKTTGVDVDNLITLAGKELPKLAWLCCKQSDEKITIAEVKRLGRRPYDLMMVVIAQVKHNKIVEEFQRFFPQVVGSLMTLIPEPVSVPMTPSTTEETLFSS